MFSQIFRLALVLAATTLFTGSLLAAGPTPVAAPEIDGSSVVTGLALVSAGILILKARRRG